MKMPGIANINEKQGMDMTYDPEKYRDKREKVLGIKKRGMSFASIAAAVSIVIITGLSAAIFPQVAAYWTTRHLDDAIFRQATGSAWPETVVSAIEQVAGVKNVKTGIGDARRLIVTYDRRTPAIDKINAVFDQNRIKVVLLNQVDHRQHHQLMENEEVTP